MKKALLTAGIIWMALGGVAGFSQVKQTRDQMMFYTSDWKGDRFPDGRPKVPDDLIKRAVDCTIEDIWGFLRQKGYANQFEGNWEALHIEKPFAGRALTAQYMPTRADMAKAIAAEGKAEGIAEGEARVLLRLLAAKHLDLSAEQQARVASCTDVAQLERWIDRVITATTATEVFAD